MTYILNDFVISKNYFILFSSQFKKDKLKLKYCTRTLLLIHPELQQS